MADPQFDKDTGRWYIRYHVSKTDRIKKLIPKHDGWKKLDKRPRTVPPQVVQWARPYQDMDAAAKLGHETKLPRGLDLRTFLGNYSATYARHNKPNSQKVLARSVAAFLEFCDGREIATLEAVTGPVCRSFVEARIDEGYAYASVKSDKAILGAAWSSAGNDQLIEYNPWQFVKVPGEDESEGTPSWANSEVAALLGVLDGWARDVFVVGINCGFRCEAIRHMQWGWVRWSPKGGGRGKLTCPKKWSKGGREYSVPLFLELHDVLARRLNEAADTGDTALVFPGKCEGGLVNASGFAQKMKRASHKAGVEWRGHAWHAMRATFATRYLERGYSPRSVQAWMCHSSLKMTDKYLKWTDEAEDAEVDRIEGRLNPGPPNPSAGP